jgi:putative endonuclease
VVEFIETTDIVHRNHRYKYFNYYIFTMPGYMYILRCNDGSYYVGSTKYLELRVAQHQAGEGARYTAKRLSVELVYYEEFARIDEAFYREKQVQGWRRAKREALIYGNQEHLPELARKPNGG